MEKIIVSILIKAVVEKVWDYYTNPLHIVNWNFADPSWHCPNAENDLTVGGIYNARMEAKDESFGFDFKAIYSHIILNKEFTFGFENRTVHVQFNEQQTNTELILTFDPENENPVELQKNGWQAILNNFKSYTESN